MKAFKLLVLIASCLVTGWVLTRTSVFRLKKVTVECDDRDLATDVERRLLSFHGKDLYRLSLSEVQKAALQEPRVREVFVRRVWPSGIRLEIEVRPVTGLMFRADGKLWMMDEKGSLFAPLSRPIGRPLVLGLTEEHPRLAEIAGWMSRLRDVELAALDPSRLNEVEWSGEKGLVVRSLEDELEIELGFTHFDRSLWNADKALTLLQARKIRANLLDASYVRRVVLKPRENLQIPPHGLNLKEIDRTERSSPNGNSAPAVR